MSQDPNGLVIPTTGTLSGLTLVTDLDNALAALATQQSGAAAPSGTLWPRSRWFDTTNNVIKRRNAANSAWVLDGAGAEAFHVSKSASYTFTLGDHETSVNITGAAASSFTIPASTTLMDGWSVMLQNNSSANQTIAPSGADLINGVNAAIALPPGSGCILVNNGVSNTLAFFSNMPASTPGSFKNLKIAAQGVNNASAVVTADAVIVEDPYGRYYTAENLNLAINSTASGANGLDAGTLAAYTWYAVWVIYNLATGTAAGLLSTSATAPALPAGYTCKARVGWVRTDGSANKYLYQTLQYGRRAQFASLASSNTPSLPQIAGGVAGAIAGSLVYVALANAVPPTASKVSVSMYLYSTSAGCNVQVSPNSIPASAGGSGSLVYSPAGFGQVFVTEFILESYGLYWASSSANNALYIQGWEDNL